MALTNAERQQRFREKHGIVRAGKAADDVDAFVELVANHWEAGARRQVDDSRLDKHPIARSLSKDLSANRPTAAVILLMAEAAGEAWVCQEFDRRVRAQRDEARRRQREEAVRTAPVPSPFKRKARTTPVTNTPFIS